MREETTKTPIKRATYPFASIVGQEGMKLGLILNVIDPSIGGVLLMGHRGTGKSTAVRALADLLPEIWTVQGCRFNCDPADAKQLCAECTNRLANKLKLRRERTAVPVVDLPLGATEDRVCGSIDFERALGEGLRKFEPGLLARANRGFLYIDEVNLLEDHLVDLLLDVSMTGQNQVERENISLAHPARFVLIGSGNPEEGELRPQLLDRFGLYVEVTTENDPERRVEIVEQRDAFERNPEKFCATWADEQKQLRQRIARAGRNFTAVKVARSLLRQIAVLCCELKIDGHRGELTIMRAARALAAFAGRKNVVEADVRRVATMALRHRLHRDPLAEQGSSLQIEQALDKAFPEGKSPAFDDDGFHSPGNPRDKQPDRRGGSAEGKAKDSGLQGAELDSSANPRANASGSETHAISATEAKLAEIRPERRANARTVKPATQGRHAGLRHTVYNFQRGRYARGVALKRAGAQIALLATLRAALFSGRDLSGDDLRYKQFARKNGTLFIFAIDASGSMALNRINQAKGALLRLLAQSYINRDNVAIVAFKGTNADVLLSPSRSIVRARRVLDTLTVGGGTPLSAGLACSVAVARRARLEHSGEIVLLLFTDGHANVPLNGEGMKNRSERQRLIESEVKRLGKQLRTERIDAIVVDTQNPFAFNSEAQSLATTLGARYFEISGLHSPGELRKP